MKARFIAVLVILLTSIQGYAQWKITGVNKATSKSVELVQIISLDSTTCVYATLTNHSGPEATFYLSRKTFAEVEGVKYKLLSSVNVPIYDEAEPKKTYMEEDGDKVNFVMIFEKFPVKDGFDIIENPKSETAWNFYGICTEGVEPTEILNTQRFLDKYPVITYGKFTEAGNLHIYYIREDVYVECEGVWSGKDIIYNMTIINNSDHGVKFDFDHKVWVTGYRKEKNGSETEKPITLYNPDSYDSYLANVDFQNAKYATSSEILMLNDQVTRERWRTDSEWGKMGLSIANSLLEKEAANNARKYLEEHPRQRPSAMKSQGIKAGESYSGYVASKSKNVDYVILHVVMDDFDFHYSWNL